MPRQFWQASVLEAERRLARGGYNKADQRRSRTLLVHNQAGSIELVSCLCVCVCVVRAAPGKQPVRVVNQHLVHMKKNARHI